MKILLWLALVCAGQFTLSAADTAYSALRVVGKQQGAEVLKRIVEVRGRAGAPEPAVWKVVMTDSGATGGVREVGVQRGKVVSESTPAGRSAPSAIDFSKLNLDSDGAYTVAKQEAEKVSAGFDHMDYTLSGGSRGPVWHLQLFQGRNTVGTIDVAADNGNVIRKSLGQVAAAEPPPQVVEETHPLPPPGVVRHSPPPADEPPSGAAGDPRYSGRDLPPEEVRRREDYVREQDRHGRVYVEDEDRDDRDDDRDYPRSGRSFPDKVRDHFLRRGSQIKHFFLGGD